MRTDICFRLIVHCNLIPNINNKSINKKSNDNYKQIIQYILYYTNHSHTYYHQYLLQIINITLKNAIS